MRQSHKPNPNSNKTEISVAKIGVISALGVAAMGMLATIISAYFSAQAAQAPILLPIRATQTSEARSTPTVAIPILTANNGTPTVPAQVVPPTAPATETSPSPRDLEQRLAAANVVLAANTPDDIARVRGYLAEPQSAYPFLAIASINVMQGLRFKQPEHLDIFDKWYTALVGEANYLTTEGTLNLEKLKEAMLMSHNDLYGDTAATFSQIVEARP